MNVNSLNAVSCYPEENIQLLWDSVPDFDHLPISLQNAVGRVRQTKRSEELTFDKLEKGQFQAILTLGEDEEVFVSLKKKNGVVSTDWSRYDELPLGVVISNADWKLIYANNAAAIMLGFATAEELLGKFASNIIYEDDYRDMQEIIQSKGQTSDPFFQEVIRFKSAQGEPKWFKSIVYSKYNHEGVVAYNVGLFMDIHEEKILERKLKRSEGRARTMFYHSQAGIVLSNSEGRVLAANDAFLAMVGAESEGEIRGQRLPEFTLDEDRQAEKVLFQDMLENKRSHYRLEKRYLHRNGGTVWGDVIVSALYGSDGEPDNFISIVQDIQSAKESQTELEELNKMKDQFFSILSHDIRNPLNAIIGLSDLALESAKRDNMPDVVDLLGMVQLSSDRLRDLVANLLDWSRSQRGTMSFLPQECDLSTILDKVRSVTEAAFLHKGVKLVFDVDSSPKLMADVHMVNSIILNLLTNAVKFSSRGDEVIVRTKVMGDRARICVVDNGMGMSPSQVEALMQSKAPERTSGTENEQGTGIGLLLVHDFIAAHGSELVVKSEPGEGSTFSFYLPLA